MTMQPETEPKRLSRLEVIAPWLRRIVILGCLMWAAVSVQTYSEDAVSHTIKASYPLLMGYERIVNRAPGFDPAMARWKPVRTGIPVADGQVIFVRTHGDVYAVKFSHQQLDPEKAECEYLKVGDTAPSVKAPTNAYPDGVALPGCKIGWSGSGPGNGYVYFDDAFIRGAPSRFEFGVPFQTGDLELYRKAVPADVHFESLPWKIGETHTEQIIPVQ